MFKWVAIGISVLLLAFFAFCYVSRVSERYCGMVEGRSILKSAELDLAKNGHCTAPNSGWSYGYWLSSNVVSIGGTQYQCFITTTNHWMHGEGALAVTTNHELIWLDSKRPPKLIAPDYRPPIFPPRF